MVDKHDMVGKQLGDYLIKDKLATGGMSYVFLGEDVSLGRRAAVKVLTPDITEDDESLPDRFKREARAVAQLEHDNIIPIYQFGELDGVYFLAMRFIDGHDFADEINDAKREGKLFDVSRALDILQQVASALDHAHANGIVHRDVKPSNVLIDNNTGKAILTDFGLVLWSNVDKTLGTAFGTPRYISPEQATDSQAAVPQSDVYSLAVIMYEITTGKMLFTGQSPMEMAISHITEKPVPPRKHNPNIPEQVEKEILKALDKEPGNRHVTAQELIDALRKAYDDAGGIEKVTEQQAKLELHPQQALPSTKSMPPANKVADDPTNPATPLVNQVVENKIQSVKPKTTSQAQSSNDNSRLMMFGGIAVTVLIIGILSTLISGGVSDPPLPTIAATDMTDESTLVAGVDVDVTDEPTIEPTDEPSPTDEPTSEPTATDEPTLEPTATDEPTDEPTPEPTATDEPTIPPTSTPQPTSTAYPILENLPPGVAVSLVYDPTMFIVRNDSEGAVVFSEMQMNSEEDGDVGDFDGSRLPVVALLPGECIVIRSETVPVPIDWNCVRERSSTLLQTEARFWFADSEEDTGFQVFWNGNAIKTCNTVGRAVGIVNGTACLLEWPVVADG